jgi:Flp pilus assembly pilin Flp
MRRIFADNRGVSSIEYGILATSIIVAVLAAMAVFSPALTDAFTALGAQLKAAM